MADLNIKKGLNIPIIGEPHGIPEELTVDGKNIRPESVALDLDPFEELRFRLLVKPGDIVKIGQPLVEDKQHTTRVFVSPGAGTIQEPTRGLKRRLLNIPITLAEHEEYIEHPRLNLNSISREELVKHLLAGGVFPHIRQRPFDLLANPEKEPRSIFVKAIETAPFAVPVELQIQGNEEDFKTGLEALKKLTSGKVHLMYEEGSAFKPFIDAKNVEKHTVSGPHPAANPSIHISSIDPIQLYTDVVWTVDVVGVIAIGHLINQGRYFIPRVISIAGNGLQEGKRIYAKTRAGNPISNFIDGRLIEGPMRFISGDPLTGTKLEQNGYLGFYDTVFTVIPEQISQEFLHFFRLGADKFSNSNTYLSGHLKGKMYEFTTNQHGEERPFITGSPYDKVMPLHLNTMLLVKAVMAEDYELAEKLGLLEVAPEDFALPTFVCPSKIEMIDIIKQGLRNYAKEVLT